MWQPHPPNHQDPRRHYNCCKPAGFEHARRDMRHRTIRPRITIRVGTATIANRRTSNAPVMIGGAEVHPPVIRISVGTSTTTSRQVSNSPVLICAPEPHPPNHQYPRRQFNFCNPAGFEHARRDRRPLTIRPCITIRVGTSIAASRQVSNAPVLICGFEPFAQSSRFASVPQLLQAGGFRTRQLS